MFTEIYCVIFGKVQGVGYRDYVDTYAQAHNLCGWIKNNEDGSVEVLIQGTPDQLKTCVEKLHEGPVLARVESSKVDWRTPKKLFDSFGVISS